MKTHFIVAAVLSGLCVASLAFCAETIDIPTKAPPLGGFWLGQPMADAVAHLGIAAQDQAISPNNVGVRVLENADRSLSLVAMEYEGVAQITLRTRDANGLLGVRVGDDCEFPRKTWGRPGGESMSDALWDFGTWVAQVHCSESGKIDGLTIGM